MEIIYQYNLINKLKNLTRGDKIRIIDGSGGDTGTVFFIAYLHGDKVIFAYQLGYLPFAKYLIANADYKTIQVYNA